jgi:hypothetical protein
MQLPPSLSAGQDVFRIIPACDGKMLIHHPVSTHNDLAYSESVVKLVTLQQNTHAEGQLLTVMIIVILLFTAMINWNIYSWLVLILVILMVITLQLKIESNKGE